MILLTLKAMDRFIQVRAYVKNGLRNGKKKSEYFNGIL